MNNNDNNKNTSHYSTHIPILNMKNIKIGEVRNRTTHQQFKRNFVSKSNGSVDKEKTITTIDPQTPGSSVKTFENCFLLKGYMMDIDDELGFKFNNHTIYNKNTTANTASKKNELHTFGDRGSTK